jgi:hypothetical protein
MIDFRQQPKGYEPGIYEMPFEQYRAIPALNSSKLKELRRTPAHFKAALEAPEKPPTAVQQKAFNKAPHLILCFSEARPILTPRWQSTWT